MSDYGGEGVRILKFGGTSLARPDRIQAVAEILIAQVRGEGARPVAVVSALAGVTDTLRRAADAAARGHDGADDVMVEVAVRHREALSSQAPPEELPELTAELDEALVELGRILEGVRLVGETSSRTRDKVLSIGERLSAPVVAAALRRRGVDAEACDARDLIVTDATFGRARVDRDRSERAIREHFADASGLQVVTGFIGATPASETTTLGKGGSDYTASLLGAALDAEAVEIWSDVDGVMSADPRLVPEAFSLPHLSYDELLEMSHWGADVVHPLAVRPLRDQGIPLLIRNTLNPDDPGTRVEDAAAAPGRGPIRGVASINRVTLLRLEGDGLFGVPTITERLFTALSRVESNVLFISQASSERSLCFALEPEAVERSRESIDREFELERGAGRVDDLVVEEYCSVIAAVGEGMRETPGIAGRLFSVLGRRGINVRAIAQGSSELNISLVVCASDEREALQTIHGAFFGAAPDPVHLYLVGVGGVGSTLLRQIREREAAAGPVERPVVVTGLADSRRAVIRPDGVELSRWRDVLEAGGTDLEGMVEAARRDRRHPRVFVDCTAAGAPVDHYGELLANGVSVVCANKKGLSGGSELYGELREAARDGAGLYYETTVGAGLPALGPLSDLAAIGDRVERIEGVLSGTLAFIFGAVMEGAPFSEAVRAAHERGYTEPDPREDLSGRDVARKALILGREMGLALEPEDVAVEGVLPESSWEELSEEEFWERLPELDGHYDRWRTEAQREGRRLRYLAQIRRAPAAQGDSRPDGERTGWKVRGGRPAPSDAEEWVRVGTHEVPPDHPTWSLKGTDNLIAVTSRRYSRAPLVVRGPGAGPDVTAAGVLADVLRAASEAPGRGPALSPGTAAPAASRRRPGQRVAPGDGGG